MINTKLHMNRKQFYLPYHSCSAAVNQRPHPDRCGQSLRTPTSSSRRYSRGSGRARSARGFPSLGAGRALVGWLRT